MDCQYDEDPSNTSSEPPVIRMTAAVTDRGIYLISKGSPPIILRQPYNRIIKWTTHSDMNIFCFWVLKEKYHLRDILALQQRYNESEGPEREAPEFEPNIYCDCVYLVSEDVTEIDFLVRCNVDMRTTGQRPLLPGDSANDSDCEDDQSVEMHASPGASRKISVGADDGLATTKLESSPQPERRTSVLNVFFKALSGAGGDVSENDLCVGQGVNESDFEQSLHDYGDDTATLANSAFRGSDQDQHVETLSDLDMVLADSIEDLTVLSNLAMQQTPVATSPRDDIRNAPRRSSLFRWATMSS